MNPVMRALNGPEDWPWVQEHLPLKQVEDTSGIVMLDQDTGERVAAVIFDTWTETGVCVHQIITDVMALRHGFFEEVARYVYDEAGRLVMVGIVPEDNEKALKIDAKIGFEELARVPHGVREGVASVILYMDRDMCRFYGPSEDDDGREEQQHPTAA